MKKTILLSVFIFLSIICFSNENPVKSVTYLKARGGWNFQIIGDINSSTFINALFSNFSKTKKKGYVWKFKDIHIIGIENQLTFQVHKGLSGKKQDGGNYFRTFTSEKYKNQLLSNKKQNETEALIIYVKDGRKHPISTLDEAKVVKDYLVSLL
ncbi:MAG: putative dithiol-disulfide oxidoreductase (DUF899 family) [Arenicella sp.]|jgi:predicted dithiol-disulfide oxidoreductase (DUF899 family)